MVLRLPFRADPEQVLSRPSSVGVVETEGERGTIDFCDFAAADAFGNLYILDTGGPYRYFLKEFNLRGKFVQSWGPVPAEVITSVAVSPGGTIWVGVDRTSSPLRPAPNQLPLLAYRSGARQPVLDWRRQMPPQIRAALKSAVVSRGGEAHFRWFVSGVQTTRNRLVLDVYGGCTDPIVDVNAPPESVKIWVVLTADGRHVLSVDSCSVYVKGNRQLAPDGHTERVSVDTLFGQGNWSKLWLRSSPDDPGAALIDRRDQPEPWKPRLILALPQHTDVPWLALDGRSHSYLTFVRTSSVPRDRYVAAGNTVLFGADAWHSPQEYALAVLDRNRQLVASIPWTPVSFEDPRNWIKPHPAGNGYYRVQFSHQELLVYRHSLPD